MTGLILAAFAAVVIMLILAISRSGKPKVILENEHSCGIEPSMPILDPQVKVEVEGVEREVFAKADLIQNMIQGMSPLNGSVKATKPIEPVDPENHPPDETGFMKAITDKVEQIKRLTAKK